jgi:phenylacetate-coenzyme A ligase PaaK-like adenylate-forming protein
VTTATTPAHWKDLRDALEHCATRVPLYRGVTAPAKDATEEACRRSLAHFPVLTKEHLRGAFPHKLVPDGVALADALKRHEVSFVGTSGTTGERVQVLWHQPWWDAQETDGFLLNALTRSLVREPGYTEAVLTTPVCSGNLCHVGKLSMEARLEGDALLFLNQTADPSLWSDADVIRMADELETFRPTALEGDPAYLAFFAVRLARLGRAPYSPRFLDLSYEFPSRRHVATIARAFKAPVLDAYGSTECGFVFMECEAGHPHHNAAWSHVEVAPLAAPGLAGTGILLVTPLRNAWLNLVRFDTGDLVRALPGKCPCGQESLALDGFEGRIKDCLVHADGRFVTVRTVDRALAPVSGLLHWKLVQRGPLDAELDLIEDGFEPLDPARATDAVASALGFAPRTRVTASVPVEASGKFRLCRAAHVDAEKLIRGAAP